MFSKYDAILTQHFQHCTRPFQCPGPLVKSSTVRGMSFRGSSLFPCFMCRALNRPVSQQDKEFLYQELSNLGYYTGNN